MIHFPNCKINLGLHIVQKRADGYHDLESVFYPLPLHDALEIVPAKEPSFASYGIDIPGDQSNNLLLKAYDLLKQHYQQIQPLQIALLKKIPTGAGLGGGSADAAEMLKMLNIFFDLKIDEPTLMQFALQLGSDCPFFIKNTPCFATGRGEILQPIPLDLSKYHFVIVKPDIHISTAWAFSQIQPQRPGKSIADIINLPVNTWKNQLKNDFELPVFKKYPEIEAIKSKLYALGAQYCSMSGSGSAVYGIFREKFHTQNIEAQIPNAEVFVC